MEHQSIDIDRITSFIGTNSAGKSTILQAIDLLLTSRKNFDVSDMYMQKDNKIVITGEFLLTTPIEKDYFTQKFGFQTDTIKLTKYSDSITSDNLKTITGLYLPKYKNKLLNVSYVSGKTKAEYKKAVEANEFPDSFDVSSIASIKESILTYIVETKPEIEGSIFHELKSKGMKELQRILPKTLYVPAFEAIDKQTKFMKTNLFGDLLQLSFQQIEENNEFKMWETRYKNLTERIFVGNSRLQEIKNLEDHLTYYIKEILPTNIVLSFNLPEVKDFILDAFELQLDDGVVTSVSQKGHGAQRAVIWSLLRNYLDVRQSNATNNTLFLVEEPELYLHPQAQRVMLRTLNSLAETEQVLYSSHSPIFVDLENISAIRLVRKQKNATQIYQFAKLGADETSLIRMIKWMGDAHNELFFAKSVILYEGATEKVILANMNETPITDVGDPNLQKKITSAQTLDQLGCQLISTGGKFAMPFFTRLLIEAQIPFFVIYDHDSSSNLDHKETNEHIKNRIRNAQQKGINSGSMVHYPMLEKDWGIEKRDEMKVEVMYKLLAQDSSIWTLKMQEKYHKLHQIVYRFAWSAFLQMKYS